MIRQLVSTLIVVISIAITGNATSADAGSLSILSISELEQLILHAPTTTITAYSLTTRSRFTQTLARACQDGKRVIVVLDRSPFAYARAANTKTSRLLSSSGCRVQTSDALFGGRQMHLKMTYVDRAMYLADTNYSIHGTVIRDDRIADRDLGAATLAGRPGANGTFATQKGLALAIEGTLLAASHGPIAIQTESFDSGTPVSDAIERAATQKVSVRLIVAANEATRGAHAQSEMRYLQYLASLGVNVRLGYANEKLGIAHGAVFIGSSNATKEIPDEIDWGLSTNQADIVKSLQEVFEHNWRASRDIAITT